ncbi:hypothetical protein [Myroides guanonis]|uniref:Uncharacterized protein n=1 Tax=Myroides guanonis TaxID=1150112 RepID=A0A1I3TFG9_9FLAO|nr:hypothetical protein [Myroides guanonis]SFJ68406.1 hypothetical protein SAMN04487893_1138 [Myroides guanonis]
MKKYYAFALVPIVLALAFFVFSKAFELLRQPSDYDVFYGVMLLCIIIFIIIKAGIYVSKNWND